MGKKSEEICGANEKKDIIPLVHQLWVWQLANKKPCRPKGDPLDIIDSGSGKIQANKPTNKCFYLSLLVFNTKEI